MSENNTQNQESKRQASSNFWKRLFILGLIMLLPIGFLVWICLFHDIPLEISKETTYITSPLTEDGHVDYFRALELKRYPKNMKTDQNGYRILVRKFGTFIDPSSFDAEILIKQAYEKLGLDPTLRPTVTYEEPYAFLGNYLNSLPVEEEKEKTTTDSEEEDSVEKLDEKLSHPWTLETMPMMAPWLEKNGPALAVIAEAVRKPEFCRPMTRISDEQDLFGAIMLPDVQKMRSFARGLSARTNYHLGTGQIDKAIDDIITMKKLGRHAGRQGTLVDAFVGIALEGIANSINLAGSFEHQLTEAQLKRFAKELQNLPPRTTLQEPMLMERYTLLDIAQKTAQRKKGYEAQDIFSEFSPKGLHGLVIKASGSLGFDWNVTMSRINWYFDNFDKINLADREHAFAKQNMYLGFLSLTSRSEMIADYLTFLFLPAIEAAQESFHRAECCDRVQKITLAMLLYEKEHGQLPPAYTIDKAGKPLHSWRVLLLPYLGEKAKKLYNQIKLDEPWDSPHNKRFHAAAVKFYQCPSSELKPGETTYSVVVGKKTAFQPGEGKKLNQLGPDSGMMILVLENHTPCNWMDPLSDLTETNAEEVLEKGTAHPGIIMSGLRGGGIEVMTRSTPRDDFQKGLEGTESNWLNDD